MNLLQLLLEKTPKASTTGKQSPAMKGGLRTWNKVLWFIVIGLGVSTLYFAFFYVECLHSTTLIAKLSYSGSGENDKPILTRSDGTRFVVLHHTRGGLPQAMVRSGFKHSKEDMKWMHEMQQRKVFYPKDEQQQSDEIDWDSVKMNMLDSMQESELRRIPGESSDVENEREIDEGTMQAERERARVREQWRATGAPRVSKAGTDFTAYETVFEYFTRDERYIPEELTSKDLKGTGVGKTLALYKVISVELPVYKKIVPIVRVEPKSLVSPMVRTVKRGEYVLGVATYSTRNSLWLRVGKEEFLPVFTRVYGKPGTTILMKFDTKLGTLKELNFKPFEKRSRECTLIREFGLQMTCIKHAHVMRETRRLLSEFNLLRIVSANSTIVPEPPSNLSFQEKMGVLFRPMSEEEICESLEWTQCTLVQYCTWIYDIQLDNTICLHERLQKRNKRRGIFLPKYDTYNKEFDFKDDPNDGKKYFVYQPSGGINNQRIQMEIALTTCLLTNRTCVIPHAAQHTNFFFRYNLHKADRLVSMQRVFDFTELRKVVDVVTIPEHLTLMEWITQVGGGDFIANPTGLKIDTNKTGGWRVIMRDSRRMVQKYIWREAEVRRFRSDESRFLFFANNTMWGTIDYFIFSPEFKAVRNSLTFAKPFKKLAMKLIEDWGEYNALHIRRGDKKRETGFLEVVRDADVYGLRMSPYLAQTPKLYIASDEKDPSYFDPIRAIGFETLFWKDLNQDLLLPFLKQFPPQMFMDVLGIIEQLICAYAYRFLGSSYSTFTMFILRMRRFYPEIAVYNQTLPDGTVALVGPRVYEGMNLTEYQSECNPFRPALHKMPC